MNAVEKEDLRHATLEALASCNQVPRPRAAIHRLVSRVVSFRITLEDVDATLEFLRGLGLVDFTLDELGSTKWWVATPAGILKIERGAAAEPPRRD